MTNSVESISPVASCGQLWHALSVSLQNSLSGDTQYVFVNRQSGEPRTDVAGIPHGCREAKLEDFHFHDLRHKAATRLGDAGVDTRRIMAILGHRCTQKSARYTHATDGGLRRAMDTLAQREKQTDTVFPTVTNSGHCWPL